MNHIRKHKPCKTAAMASIFLLFHRSARTPDGTSNIIVNILQRAIKKAMSGTDIPLSINKIV